MLSRRFQSCDLSIGKPGQSDEGCNCTKQRKDVVTFFVNLEPRLIGMGACGSAHYWARKLSELGHTVRLMAPQIVKPYVKTNKSDRDDAEAIPPNYPDPLVPRRNM